MAMEITELIDRAAEAAVDKAIRKLKQERLIKDNHRTSYKKMEGMLKLYPSLSYDNENKKKIDQAIEALDKSEDKDILRLYYFQYMTLEDIADIYERDIKTIWRKKKALVMKLTEFIFPNDVINEIKDTE